MTNSLRVAAGAQREKADSLQTYPCSLEGGEGLGVGEEREEGGRRGDLGKEWGKARKGKVHGHCVTPAPPLVIPPASLQSSCTKGRNQ